jgi:hypothetical protein
MLHKGSSLQGVPATLFAMQKTKYWWYLCKICSTPTLHRADVFYQKPGTIQVKVVQEIECPFNRGKSASYSMDDWAVLDEKGNPAS